MVKFDNRRLLMSNEKVRTHVSKEKSFFKVLRYLSSKDGFAFADASRKETTPSHIDTNLSILYEDPDAKPLSWAFRLLGAKRRRLYLGSIWFSIHGANEENWLFKVYGSKNMEVAKRLADELAAHFEVNITLDLVSEEPLYETFPGEGYPN